MKRVFASRSNKRLSPLLLGLLLLLAYNGLYTAWLVVHPAGPFVHKLVANLANAIGPVLAWVAFMVSAARAGRLRPGARRRFVGPLLLALSALGYGVGQFIWTYYEHVLHVELPTPSWADVGYLSSYPFLLLGVLLLPARPIARAARTRIVLDGLVAMTALVTFIWYFLLGPIILAGLSTPMATLVSAAYPFADLVLLFCLFALAARVKDRALKTAAVFLSLGQFISVVTDTVYGLQVLHETYVTGTILDAGWPLGYMLIVLGAQVCALFSAARQTPAATENATALANEKPLPAWSLLLPYVLLPAVGALTLWVAAGHRAHGHLLVGLYVGAVLLVALTLLRQVFAVLENRHLYHTLENALCDVETTNRQITSQADALRLAEERTRRIVETALDAVIGMDAAGIITDWNARAEAIFGWSRAEAVGRSLSSTVIPPGDRPAHGRSLTQFLTAGEAHILGRRVEVEALHRDGHTFPAELSVSPVHLAGKDVCFSGFVRDITDRKKAEETIRFQAHHDTLTGLPNRILFQDRLDQALARARRTEQQVAVLFLDLDRFKFVNDTLGHAAGDRLLVEVAGRLRACLRADDTIARMGGDEFTVLLPSAPLGACDAVRAADKLLGALALPVSLDGHDLRVTVSVGISLFPHDGEDAETLLKHADVAMYQAKEKGRIGYQLFTDSMNTSALERLTLEADLRRALEQNEFCLFYQPQFSAREECVVGVEALVRWRHPARGLVSPVRFIPLAEEVGLIVPLGNWVLEEACRQAAHWQAEGRPLRVAVNVAARQLQAEGFAERVARVLEETGLHACWLDLELTESVLIETASPAAETLKRLRASGVRVAVDDFGTGYSSLSYLRAFPLDVLKIDRSFVRDLTTDAADGAVVRALIDLAHGLHLEVIAEGVETNGQCDCLRALGCDVFQGFLFGPPVPLEALENLLHAEENAPDFPLARAA